MSSVRGWVEAGGSGVRLDIDVAVLCITHSSVAVLDDFALTLPEGMAGLTYKVVVVDSGSTDLTLNRVAALMPDAATVRIERNVGFAAAINRGYSWVRDQCDTDFIIIVNPDVRLHAGAAARLVDAMRGEVNVGIVVPRLVDEHGELQWSLRRRPRTAVAWAEALLGSPLAHRLGTPTGMIRDPRFYDSMGQADWATGGMIVVSTDVADLVGEWDERYFLYEEEVDFCLRAADAGFELRYVPEAVATRVVGARQPEPWAHALMQINRVSHLRRRGLTLQARSVWIAEVVGDGLRLLRGRAEVRPALWALLRGAQPQEVVDRYLPTAHAVVTRTPPRSIPLPQIADDSPRASVVIPAHNEESVLGRTLGAILGGVPRGTFEVIVVCNGCRDDTAGVAAAFGDDLRVLEIAEPSKYAALRAGDSASSVYPRIYVDADVVIDGHSLVRLAKVISSNIGIEAAAPERTVPREGVSLAVRWYYDIWEQLPQVRSGLFGRGVIAVSRIGHHRIMALPSVMSDDLAVDEAFLPSEKAVVAGSRVVVRPPRRLIDLWRRRVRVATGNAQIDQLGLRTKSSRTTFHVLARLTFKRPSLALRLPVFLGLTVASRLSARRAVGKGDYRTWLRDDSSRG